MSYQYSKIKDNNNLISILSQEAKEKVTIIRRINDTPKNIHTILEKKKSKSNEDANSSSYSSSSSSQGSSSSYSSSFDNVSISNKDSEQENEPEPEPEQEQVANSESQNKHYHSFMIQYKNKNPNLMKIPKFKNFTTKSQFDKKKSIKDQPLYEKISNKMKEKKSISLNFKYYEVKINHIRFLKYDFFKETVVEENYPEKTDQMTKIINEINSSLDKLEHKDENYPSINFEHFTYKKKKTKKIQ
jgi:hypothetical protein